jgi:hypothetical protein
VRQPTRSCSRSRDSRRNGTRASVQNYSTNHASADLDSPGRDTCRLGDGATWLAPSAGRVAPVWACFGRGQRPTSPNAPQSQVRAAHANPWFWLAGAGRCGVAANPHNPKVAGSNPAPATMDDEGLADAGAANPFALPRLHPGIGLPAWTPPHRTVVAQRRTSSPRREADGVDPSRRAPLSRARRTRRVEVVRSDEDAVAMTRRVQRAKALID